MCFNIFLFYFSPFESFDTFLEKEGSSSRLDTFLLLYSNVSDRCAYVSDSCEVLFATGRALNHIKRTQFYKRKKETQVGLNIQREREREEKRARQC